MTRNLSTALSWLPIDFGSSLLRCAVSPLCLLVSWICHYFQVICLCIYLHLVCFYYWDYYWLLGKWSLFVGLLCLFLVPPWKLTLALVFSKVIASSNLSFIGTFTFFSSSNNLNLLTQRNALLKSMWFLEYLTVDHPGLNPFLWSFRICSTKSRIYHVGEDFIGSI